uniref:prepilin peptidase n=1 Tax=Thaumasiovibrio occultus TaxID=1891184 RepID=UPI000B353168|nr:A24 family peptidase [Thaumasiovibrio occultus]
MELFSFYPWLFPIFATVFGLLIGSFLNVVIFRLPKMMEQEWKEECHEYFPETVPEPTEERITLSHPASTCPKCNTGIKFYDNIPVISWLLLRGKCRQCSNPISARYPLVELLTGTLALVVSLHFPAGPWGFALLGFTFVLVALTFIDFDTQLLPDSLTLPLMWAGIVTALLGWSPLSLETSIIGAMTGYLSLWSIYWLFKLLTGKEGMGYGDFKLFAALGAWLGWSMLPMIILMASIAGTVGGVIQLRRAGKDNQQPFSFGPYLAIAGWIALIWGDTLLNMYLSYAFGG